ncbi:MAG: alpha/beta hydrolase [Bacteroidota bacterium]
MHTQLQAWSEHGQWIELSSPALRIFVLDEGDASATPDQTLLLIHGFPESSFSFHKVLEGLSQRFSRIILLDMPGYGLSAKPSDGYSYSLIEQADVMIQVWQQLGITGGHLLGHDMGTSIATEICARFVRQQLPLPDGLLSVTLTNGSMVMAFSKLRITQKLLLRERWGPGISRLMTRSILGHQVRSAHGNDHLSEEDIDLLWENIKLENGHHRSYQLIKYIRDRYRFEESRWLPSLAALDIPVHLCWGVDDRVAIIEMAEHLKREIVPQATFTRLEGVGHFGQLAEPEEWLEGIMAFYGS